MHGCGVLGVLCGHGMTGSCVVTEQWELDMEWWEVIVDAGSGVDLGCWVSFDVERQGHAWIWSGGVLHGCRTVGTVHVDLEQRMLCMGHVEYWDIVQLLSWKTGVLCGVGMD